MGLARTEPVAGPTLRALRRKAHYVSSRLAREYGTPDLGNRPDPVEELVYIVLSQMTTAKSLDRAFGRLRIMCPEWQRLACMPLRDVRRLIGDAGLGKVRALRLKEIVARLVDEFGCVTLQPLERMSDSEAESYLCSLPGVGVKTAKCVLLFAFGRSVLPVDTHIKRVSVRLGLLPESTPVPRIHGTLARIVRPADRLEFHVNVLAHGQRVCIAAAPRCFQCVLRNHCCYHSIRLESVRRASTHAD